MLLCPFLPWLTSRKMSVYLKEGIFSLGGRKFLPSIMWTATWTFSKLMEVILRKKSVQPPIICLGSSRQNTFQSINRELDLLVLASLCKQISSSERWCSFQKQKGHSLHMWNRYYLAALFSSELVTNPLGCFLCQVIPCNVRGAKIGIAALCLCISRHQMTNGRAGSNLGTWLSAYSKGNGHRRWKRGSTCCKMTVITVVANIQGNRASVLFYQDPL